MISAKPEIRVYDREMQFQGIIDAASSLQWHRKYYEPGDLELHCPMTQNNIELLQRGNLVYLKGAKEAAVVEHREIHDSAVMSELTIKGRFSESYMDRRLIRPFFHTENGSAENAMRNMFSMVYPIPRVELAPAYGFAKKITFQATYKNLLVYEEKLAKYLQAGFRFRPDFAAKKYFFELYAGLDRTTVQRERPWVIFSDGYGNLTDFVYAENDQIHTNVCYVGGEGEGADRTFVTAGDDSLTGLDRREVFYSAASDIRSEGLTEGQYKAALLQRGEDYLQPISQSIESAVNPNGNYVYKEDYDLGDLVTVRKEKFGIEVDERIVEVNEIYEGGAFSVALTFGTPIPETIDWTNA